MFVKLIWQLEFNYMLGLPNNLSDLLNEQYN